MLRIDRVLAVSPGQAASALVSVTGGDAMVRGGATFPAVLLIEAMAQVAALFAEEEGRAESGSLAALANVSFGDPVPVGCLLTVSARLAGRFGKLVKVEGRAEARGQVAAQGEITIATS